MYDSLGGNNLIYNESEDAYYIQHGADAVLKKLGDSKPICLGTARTYDLTSYNGYEDFTEDNFICVCESNGTSSSSQNRWQGDYYIVTYGSFTAPVRSYDASTGILTITKGTVGSYSTKNGSSTLHNSSNLTVTTYLIP